MSQNNAKANNTEEKVSFTYQAKGVLKVSGNGHLAWSDVEDILWEEDERKIRKIVFEEGITGIEDGWIGFWFSEVEEIELPQTLTVLGKSALEGCGEIEKIDIPEGVAKIEKNVFSNCERLMEISIPSSLTTWNSPIKDCPMLRKICNLSSVELELDDCKGNKTWSVDGTKVTKLLPGKTAKAKGKKFKIKYKLLGGKKIAKLPTYYRYGSNMKLPTSVKKKGYTFLGWYKPKDTARKSFSLEISPDLAKDITLKPCWVKCRVKNVKKRKLKIVIEDAACLKSYSVQVRYSKNKDMTRAKYCNVSELKRKMTIKNLKKNSCYYIQFAPYESDAYDSYEGNWEKLNFMGKKKVIIRK